MELWLASKLVIASVQLNANFSALEKQTEIVQLRISSIFFVLISSFFASSLCNEHQ